MLDGEKTPMDREEKSRSKRENLQLEGSEIAEISYILHKKIKALESKKFKNQEIIRILKRDAERLEEKRKLLDKRLGNVAKRRKR
jgi:hypothetical protein